MFFNSFLHNNIKDKLDHDRTSNDSLSLPQHLLQPLQHPRHNKEWAGVDDNSKSDTVQPSVDDKEAILVVSGGIGDAGGADGATIEVPKRRRGRPPGSKNKPRPTLFITRYAEPTSATMRPHVLEIPTGHDVGDSLARFARRHNLGICVLAGSGAVANVVLRQPKIGLAQQPLVPAAAATTATVALRGRLEILSISATFLPPVMAALSPGISGEMSISLAGPQGQVVGGAVAGPLMTAGTVVVVAAAFSNPSFHRLPLEDEVMVRVSISGGSEADETENHKHGAEKQRGHRKRDRQGRQEVSAAESCDMSICSFHASPDVVWAPSSRQQPPPPPPPF